jgi:ribosome-binding factor A
VELLCLNAGVKAMPNKSQAKNNSRLSEDIKRELIEIINNMKDPRLKAGLVTITQVVATADLGQCKVYVSVLGTQDATKKTVAALTAASGHVRSEISSRMHIRKAPQFVFFEDNSAAYAEHINKLLKDAVGSSIK